MSRESEKKGETVEDQTAGVYKERAQEERMSLEMRAELERRMGSGNQKREKERS